MIICMRSLLSRRSFGAVFRNNSRTLTVLGIETSCDDTGVGIVKQDGARGKIIGEKLFSQQNIHTRFGGIIPPIAQDHHRENIDRAVKTCIEESQITMNEIDAVAVTNRPGLPMSLEIGLRYAKYLCRKFSKPLIPIHHMEAHALTARLGENIPFPYMCLLISGGHCQLVIVKGVDKFYLLGESIDDAPGEAFDKIARRLKLQNLPEFDGMSGGRAIEVAASQSEDPTKFDFPLPLARYRDCQFSFAGLKNNAQRLISKLEQENETRPDEVIPAYREFCRDFLGAIAKHIRHRLQRGIEYSLQEGLISKGDVRSLVVAGGVAANDFIFRSCSEVAKHFNFESFRAPKRLCADNGVMIAWNGIEKLISEPTFSANLEEVNVINKCSLGESLIDKVAAAELSCKWVKIDKTIKKSSIDMKQ